MRNRRPTSKSDVQKCEWWALCTNDATTTEPHPILGDVPICARCAEKIRRIEAATIRPEG